MARVRVNRHRAESGQLPRSCMCCGSPAQRMVVQKFYWQPTWFVFVYPLLPRFVKWYWYFMRPLHLAVPLCDKHSSRFKRPLYVLLALAAPLLLLVPGMIALVAIKSELVSIMAILLLLNGLAFVAGYFLSTILTPRLHDYDSNSVEFTAVSAGFAEAASGGVIGQRPLPGLPRQQPLPGLPQQQQPAPGGMSPGMLTLLIGGGCVGGTLLVACAGGAILYFTAFQGGRRGNPLAMRPGGNQFPPAGFPQGNAPPWDRMPVNARRPPTTTNTPPKQTSPWNAPPGPPSTSSATPPGPPTTASRPPGPPDPLATTPAASSNVATTPAAMPVASSPAPTTSQPGGVTVFDENSRPLRASPRRGEPTQFPPGNYPVTSATRLAIGDQVWALWGGSWFPAQVLEVQGADLVKIHYYGWSSASDDSIERSKLRLANPPQATDPATVAAAPPAAIEPPSTAQPPPPGNPFLRPPAPSPPAAPAEPQLRTWTDSTGKHKIEAKLLESAGGQVKLQRADGKLVTLPHEKLSTADQEYLRGLP